VSCRDVTSQVEFGLIRITVAKIFDSTDKLQYH